VSNERIHFRCPPALLEHLAQRSAADGVSATARRDLARYYSILSFAFALSGVNAYELALVRKAMAELEPARFAFGPEPAAPRAELVAVVESFVRSDRFEGQISLGMLACAKLAAMTDLEALAIIDHCERLAISDVVFAGLAGGGKPIAGLHPEVRKRMEDDETGAP